MLLSFLGRLEAYRHLEHGASKSRLLHADDDFSYSRPLAIDTRARILGWGIQEPDAPTHTAASQSLPTNTPATHFARRLKGYATLKTVCADFVAGQEWISEIWPDSGKPVFICTGKAVGGACDGDIGGERVGTLTPVLRNVYTACSVEAARLQLVSCWVLDSDAYTILQMADGTVCFTQAFLCSVLLVMTRCEDSTWRDYSAMERLTRVSALARNPTITWTSGLI